VYTYSSRSKVVTTMTLVGSRRVGSGQDAGDLQTIRSGHADVGQDDVGTEPAGAVDGGGTVGGLAHGEHVGLRVQDHPEADPDVALVIGHQDPDRCRGHRVRGGHGSSGVVDKVARVGVRAEADIGRTAVTCQVPGALGARRESAAERLHAFGQAEGP
jgi:hypothetical protein